MKSKQQSPVWPYLGILACLFVLSITAPRAWDRMARQETLSQVLASRAARPTAARYQSPESDPYEQVDSREFNARDAVDEQVYPPIVEQPLVAQVAPPVAEFAQQIQEPLEATDRADVLAADPATETPVEETLAEKAPPKLDEEPAVAPLKWPLPRVLLEQLNGVLAADLAAAWARQAIDLVHELCAPGSRTSADAISQLRKICESKTLATGAKPELAARIARARYSLTRWLDVLEAAAAWDVLQPSNGDSAVRPDRMSACLSGVEALTQKGAQGPAWRAYLQLDALRRLDDAAPEQSTDERRAVARKILDRLSSSQLTQSQRKFLSEKPVTALQGELRSWAAEPVAASRLLAHLEQYERSGLPSDARLVADDWRGLNWSAPAEAEHVSKCLETHYGNANVRVAVSTPLLNRMVPQPEKMEAPVRDTVLNVPTFGHSTTQAKLKVLTVPDTKRIRVGLEAHGLVSSDTVSTSGPATFRNSGQSTFLVRKLIVIGPQGMTIWPAVAEAENKSSYLVSLETEFDGVPLLNSLVRNIARNQHDEKQGQARSEVEQKVATRALDQFDAEVRPHLVKAAEDIQKRQAAAFKNLGLEIVPVGMSTTEDRVVARMRVAGTEQIGAHTPRPRAPSDSWFSMQVHQSALNNGLEGLDLNGREFKLPDLFAWLAKKLDRPELADNDDLPENVHATFAKQDAVRLRCEAGRVEVLLSFAKLTQGRKAWHNFTVHTFYVPDPDKLEPRFVRDRAISLEGKSVRGPEPLLRAIFSRVLSRNRDISLLDKKFTDDPRLEGLDISQFVVEDGWIGLAYSPHRAPNVARRPK